MVRQGYALPSLAYFKAQGLPSSLEDIPIEYFDKAFSWLSAQRGIIPDEVAILVGSKGAEAALLLSSLFSQVKVVVALSPSCVVWQGIPKQRFELGKVDRSSWSYHGESLVLITGYSTCSYEPLDGPALRTAKIANDLVAE